MSDSEPGGAHTPASSGASSASTTTATTGSTTGATPKLKLTFKLAEIRAASPVPSSTSGDGEAASAPEAAAVAGPAAKKPRRPAKRDVAAPASSSSFVTPYKKARKEAAPTGSATAERPSSKETNSSSVTTTISPPPSGASSRIQFPEQLAFVREMKKLRVRRWRREPTTVGLLGGRSLSLPCWARDRPSAPPATAPGAGGPSKTRASNESTAAFAPTFVCTWEGCHKIFDAKDKWRRHLNLHRRKERKAAAAAAEEQGERVARTEVAPKAGPAGGNLQLKLNLGSLLKKASSATNITDNAVGPPTPDSGALEEVDIS